MKQLKTYITLDQMKFYSYHGVSPQETRVGNTFIVDLKVKTDLSIAIESDDLRYTINYADIYNAVKQEMEIPSKLLEHACGRIMNRLFNEFPSIMEIDIKLSKKNPPMGADMESAGVVMHCCRQID